MARSRRLDALRADAYKRSDNESATDRFPSAEVDRYINQGRAELYDLLIEARGRTYFRKDPPSKITTAANTSRYALPADFYRLISVRTDGTWGDTLTMFTSQDEPVLRSPGASGAYPTHYELQAAYLELLPLHAGGLSVVVDYIPAITDLVLDTDTTDGFNGWEEYIVAFAARCMAIKDEEWPLAKALGDEMQRLAERIRKLAPTRDAFRPERVKDARGALALSPWRIR